MGFAPCSFIQTDLDRSSNRAQTFNGSRSSISIFSSSSSIVLHPFILGTFSVFQFPLRSQNTRWHVTILSLLIQNWAIEVTFGESQGKGKRPIALLPLQRVRTNRISTIGFRLRNRDRIWRLGRGKRVMRGWEEMPPVSWTVPSLTLFWRCFWFYRSRWSIFRILRYSFLVLHQRSTDQKNSQLYGIALPTSVLILVLKVTSFRSFW